MPSHAAAHPRHAPRHPQTFVIKHCKSHPLTHLIHPFATKPVLVCYGFGLSVVVEIVIVFVPVIVLTAFITHGTPNCVFFHLSSTLTCLLSLCLTCGLRVSLATFGQFPDPRVGKQSVALLGPRAIGKRIRESRGTYLRHRHRTALSSGTGHPRVRVSGEWPQAANHIFHLPIAKLLFLQ